MSLKDLIHQTGEAEFILPYAPGVSFKEPVRFFMTPKLLQDLDEKCVEQAVNTAATPGVEKLTVGPDAHAGYGCPVGSVVVTKDTIMPGPVGPDICCSMSYLQTNVPHEAVKDLPTRRAIINAICERIPTGANNRLAPKGRGNLSPMLLMSIVTEGPTPENLRELGIPEHWGQRTEIGLPTSEMVQRLRGRFEELLRLDHKQGYIASKIRQIGSYGGGNHFGEAQVTQVTNPEIAEKFGLSDGHIGFLSHCGSRGFGYRLAERHFKGLVAHFEKWHIPFPGGDKELVYAPVDSPEGQAYLLDMTMGAHMATVNHLLLNILVAEAFTEVLGPQFDAEFVYHIAHNIGREELWKPGIKGNWDRAYVWRKGATRAFPGNHPELARGPYAGIGHPILLPGNPTAGSKIMVAQEGAQKSAFSINHGAGRAMGRKEAKRVLTQESVQIALTDGDVLFNGRNYPIDEAPAAYKDFNEVCGAVEKAGLAQTVANLKAVFVIKDSDQDQEGTA